MAVVLDVPAHGARSRARARSACRWPTATSTTSTRCSSEITAATQIAIVCNPNNPTGTYLPAERIAAFLESVPEHVTVIVDEAYIEFQAVDDPDATIDLLAEHPNLVLLRTFSKCYGLAGLRVGYALCSPQFRAAVDAVRQPFSVNALAQAAAAEAILHQDDVTDRVEQNLVERIFVEEGLRGARASRPPDSQANFSWVDLGDRDEAEVVDVAGARRASRCGPGTAARAARATSASPTAPAPRTSASSRRSPTRSDEPRSPTSARTPLVQPGQMEPHQARMLDMTPRAARRLAACVPYWYWRFS